MSVPTLSMACLLAGQPQAVVRCRLHERISQPTAAQLELACSQELEPAAMLRSGATVELLLNGGAVRSVQLLVAAGAFTGIEGGSLRYALDLRAPLWLLGLGRNTRKFRVMSAKDIVTQVLGEAGIAASWRLRREPPVRKYCMQYRESNLAFVSRLLESEGIYYSCDDGGGLLLADHSPSSPAIAGGAALPLLGGQHGLVSAEVGIEYIGSGARVASGKATVNDYNWKTPRVELLASQAAGQDSELERYEFPAGYRTPAQGMELAQRRLEAYRAKARFARGRGNAPTLTPARKFSVASTAGDYLLTEVTHTFSDPAYSTDTTTPADALPNYHNRFEAIGASVPFRPAPVTPRPIVQGCHTAMVRGPAGEEIHTDQYGRFRGQFHWDREAKGSDQDSRWMRKLQEPSTSVNLARVGWEVSVAYIDGDPDRPIGIARTINGVMRPSYAQPANKQVMTIKTPTYPGKGGFNEIMLDDGAGAQRFSVRAERDFINKVLLDKTETIGNDDVCSVAKQMHHDVGGDQTVEVAGDRVMEVSGNKRSNVHGAEQLQVGGTMKLNVHGSVVDNIGGNDREAVGSVRLSIVGGISLPDIGANAKQMVPDPQGAASGAAHAGAHAAIGGGGLSGATNAAGGSLQSMVPTPQGAAGLNGASLSSLASGSISRAAPDSLRREVGAVYLAASGESITNAAEYLATETIGGAKLTLTGGDLSQSAGEVMVHTVGGALLRKTAEDMSYAANNARVLVGGMLKLKSNERIEISGKTVTLQAAARLRFKSEELELTLEPARIKVKGSLRPAADSKITFTGNKDDLAKAAE